MTQLAPHHARTRTLDGPVAVLDTGPAGWPAATALLIPGYTGSKEDFAPLLDPLAAAGYRVVAMDQPGQYESPGPDEPAGYTVERQAQAVQRVVKALDDGPVHLLGHSFGGLVARAAVLAEPAAFRSLTLLGSGPAAIGGPRVDRMTALEPLLPLGMSAVYDAMERMAQFYPAWKTSSDELKAFLRVRFEASTAAGLRGMGDALLAEPDRTDELRAVGLPVQVVYGEADDAWQPATQAEMARRLGAPAVVVPDAVHSPAIENTAATIEALARFWGGV